MAVPVWLFITSAALRTTCGVQAHQLGCEDDAAFEAHIEGVFAECAPVVASRARRAASPLFFPFTPATLALAYPREDQAERVQRSDDLQGTAREALRSMVIAKLNYAIPGDTYQGIADGKWRGAMSLLSELEKGIADTVKQHQSLAKVTAFFFPEPE